MKWTQKLVPTFFCSCESASSHESAPASHQRALASPLASSPTHASPSTEEKPPPPHPSASPIRAAATSPSRRRCRFNSLSMHSGRPPLPVVRGAKAGRTADPECRLLLHPSSTSSIQGKQQIQAGTRPFTSPCDSWLAGVPPLPIIRGVKVGRATDPEHHLLLCSSSAPLPSPSSMSDDLLPPCSLPERRPVGRPSLPGTAKPRVISIAENPHFVCKFVLL
jgi:hypothetical protein